MFEHKAISEGIPGHGQLRELVWNGFIVLTRIHEIFAALAEIGAKKRIFQVS